MLLLCNLHNCILLHHLSILELCCINTTNDTTQYIPNIHEPFSDAVFDIVVSIQQPMQHAFVVLLYCIAILFKDTIQYNKQRLQYNITIYDKSKTHLRLLSKYSKMKINLLTKF